MDQLIAKIPMHMRREPNSSQQCVDSPPIFVRLQSPVSMSTAGPRISPR